MTFQTAEFFPPSLHEMRRLHLHSFPRDVVEVLSRHGFDVTRSKDFGMQTASELELARFCVQHGRTLVTRIAITPDVIAPDEPYPPIIVVRCGKRPGAKTAQAIRRKIQSVRSRFASLRPYPEGTTAANHRRARKRKPNKTETKPRHTTKGRSVTPKPSTTRTAPSAAVGNTRLHLDECVHGQLAERLRSHGFDVTTTPLAGLVEAPDSEQLRYCEQKGRTLITCDTGIPRQEADGPFHVDLIVLPPPHVPVETMVDIVLDRLTTKRTAS